MAGTKEGARKRRETLIKRYGSIEAYNEEMRRRQSKGGSAKRARPFEIDPKLASEAGIKGRINRYGRNKVQG
jgi:hypothetical protein